MAGLPSLSAFLSTALPATLFAAFLAHVTLVAADDLGVLFSRHRGFSFPKVKRLEAVLDSEPLNIPFRAMANLDLQEHLYSEADYPVKEFFTSILRVP